MRVCSCVTLLSICHRQSDSFSRPHFPMLPSDSLWEGFWVVARSSFGWSELLLLQVVFLFEDGLLDPFQKAFGGRCALHFSSALEASCCSAKRFDDVIRWVSRTCRSAIPLSWVMCHANMSVCMVMILPRVSRHCGTLEVHRCKAL